MLSFRFIYLTFELFLQKCFPQRKLQFFTYPLFFSKVTNQLPESCTQCVPTHQKFLHVLKCSIADERCRSRSLSSTRAPNFWVACNIMLSLVNCHSPQKKVHEFSKRTSLTLPKQQISLPLLPAIPCPKCHVFTRRGPGMYMPIRIFNGWMYFRTEASYYCFESFLFRLLLFELNRIDILEHMNSKLSSLLFHCTIISQLNEGR